MREAFIQCRRTYKQFLETKEKEYFEKLKLQSRSLEKDNSKQFWNITKHLQNDNNVNIQNPVEYETWEKYFKQLYSSEPQGNKFIHQSTNQEPFQNHDAEAIDQIINRVITVNEIKQAIGKLKKGKAAEEDSIINEVLKIGEFCLQNQSQNWSRNLLVVIHKGGAKDDPDNCREISISFCLSKLCSTVLYLRVLEVNESFSLINDKQIGFLKGNRTSDHVLLIDIIIHETVQKCKERLFV